MSISYWQDTVKNQTNDRNQRPIPRRTDVAVVGGGIAGILIAYYLQIRWKKVVLFGSKTYFGRCDSLYYGKSNVTARIGLQGFGALFWPGIFVSLCFR